MTNGRAYTAKIQKNGILGRITYLQLFYEVEPNHVTPGRGKIPGGNILQPKNNLSLTSIVYCTLSCST